MHRVVITGGTGFLGQLLGREIGRLGSLLSHTHGGAESFAPVSEILLADVAKPSRMLFKDMPLTDVVVGDLADAGYCRALVSGTDGPISIFHLGAVMSGQGESDFDLCLNTNLHGTLHLLEAARHCGAARPRFILASAGATLGAGASTDYLTKDDVVADSTRATPHTTCADPNHNRHSAHDVRNGEGLLRAAPLEPSPSPSSSPRYGMTKACSELLLSDYSRRGFVDGRGVRLPSVLVRAGSPNAATTGCFSTIVRSP